MYILSIYLIRTLEFERPFNIVYGAAILYSSQRLELSMEIHVICAEIKAISCR